MEHMDNKHILWRDFDQLHFTWLHIFWHAAGIPRNFYIFGTGSVWGPGVRKGGRKGETHGGTAMDC